MPRAIVDPEEVFRFAAFLNKTSGALRERQSAVMVGFARLHEVWRDDKYRQFDQTFADAMKEIQRFLIVSESFEAFLRTKGEKARRYLDLRY